MGRRGEQNAKTVFMFPSQGKAAEPWAYNEKLSMWFQEYDFLTTIQIIFSYIRGGDLVFTEELVLF